MQGFAYNLECILEDNTWFDPCSNKTVYAVNLHVVVKAPLCIDVPARWPTVNPLINLINKQNGGVAVAKSYLHIRLKNG